MEDEFKTPVTLDNIFDQSDSSSGKKNLYQMYT